MTNRLINEKSPYLLQHAGNPVEWHPWGDEAFKMAADRDKPIFLSIGYATCHWCHVMERESFEDVEAADALNRTFVCIKVDREERPDIDTVYMNACQMITGSGGWPLSICMTPDKKPFFAGTYIPKNSGFGRIGVIELSERIRTLWETDRQKIFQSADSVSESLSRSFDHGRGVEPETDLLEKAHQHLADDFDPVYGGFKPAPKFPTPHRLSFLLRRHYRTAERSAYDMVKQTLIRMRLGGIWDHVGFGFHRYSTDERWFLPHFEKMLYDQALLAKAYLDMFQISGEHFFSQTAEEIFTYVLRDMTSPEGAFYTAEDADSEGEEGKFYVWRLDELKKILGPEEADFWAPLFNLTESGNYIEEATRHPTGTNILHLKEPFPVLAQQTGINEQDLKNRWETARKRLFQTRENRPHPLKDDKILTDWNGLMISALARAARALNRKEYEAAAATAADFILDRLSDSQGRLFHRFRSGESGIQANADDYAFFIMGMIDLYQTTFDSGHLRTALALQTMFDTHFEDAEQGGYYLTAEDAEPLPVRPKSFYDGATPSANSVALENLMRLSRLTGNTEYDRTAQRLSRACAAAAQTHPHAFTQYLIGLDLALHPTREIVIVGEGDHPDSREMLRRIGRRYVPETLLIYKTIENASDIKELAGFTEPLEMLDNRPTAYVCADFSCSRPTTDIEEVMSTVSRPPAK